MGCLCSKENVASNNQAPANPIPLQPVDNLPRRPERTEGYMTQNIRSEFLAAVHESFGSMEYGIIGGVALAEYGNRRGTSDIDVIVPENVSEVVEDQLCSGKIVHTARGGLGYIASNGQCYGLDITTDKRIGQKFICNCHTRKARNGAEPRVVTIGFLLNSKAYSYVTRTGPDELQKKANDASDIFFIVDFMRNQNISANRQESRWVVDYDFWTTFCRDYEGAEARFQAIGLQRDATPNPSNRSTRRNSSISAQSRSSGHSNSANRRQV